MNYRLNANNVVSDTIDGEVLAIRSDNGAYYSMRGPAASSWVALLTGADLDRVAELVAAHHGADLASVRSDIERFAHALADESLLIPGTSADLGGESGDGGEVVLPDETAGSAWVEPEFERYTDMRDLLLFDPIHEVESTGWPAVKPATD